eukprot:TRINITY_DN5836_c0_g2_i3.p2 TRINITY_DN5836_c0_g2~~TRINITY_DN5836_c0_g2_i3.p2  ORF type:complete len:223 (+),score=34.38 TRINITY_DN5836_c0_g2_i3:65-733(+)
MCIRDRYQRRVHGKNLLENEVEAKKKKLLELASKLNETESRTFGGENAQPLFAHDVEKQANRHPMIESWIRERTGIKDRIVKQFKQYAMNARIRLESRSSYLPLNGGRMLAMKSDVLDDEINILTKILGDMYQTTVAKTKVLDISNASFISDSQRLIVKTLVSFVFFIFTSSFPDNTDLFLPCLSLCVSILFFIFLFNSNCVLDFCLRMFSDLWSLIVSPAF